jgi:hypothetical protein
LQSSSPISFPDQNVTWALSWPLRGATETPVALSITPKFGPPSELPAQLLCVGHGSANLACVPALRQGNGRNQEYKAKFGQVATEVCHEVSPAYWLRMFSVHPGLTGTAAGIPVCSRRLIDQEYRYSHGK